MPSAFATAPANAGAAQRQAETQLAVLERLPVGLLIHRNEQLIYANRAFLEWTGYADLAAVAAAGGLERLVVDPQAGALDRVNGTGKTFTIATRTGDTLICEGRLYTRAVERRERADAGAGAHRGRRIACAIPKSRCARPKPRRANCARSSTPRPTA